jgi:hypothetical protein
MRSASGPSARPAARAIGLITAHQRRRRTVYRVVGHCEGLTSVTAAAVVAERIDSRPYVAS